jgi:hypothetical protein
MRSYCINTVRHTKQLPIVQIAAGLLLFLGVATTIQAQSNLEEDAENQKKPWQENAIVLPAAPQAADLLPFEVATSMTQTFAIDAKSLSISMDGVIRYTLVAQSQSGAKNISYEGIRCQTFEKKLYSFGHKDGSWSLARRDQWESIIGSAVNRPHVALAQDYFCQNKTSAGDAAAILDRMKRKRQLPQ